ncbi:MAG: hypothetical protein JNJ61_06310 [Anaerolineae bacterium]|nr:hypothetical protein [Anaerolineae bacterium]
MQICLDVVDLLQLREIWSQRPIITAFTRLEPRAAAVPNDVDFRIEDLMPRLYRLKRSSLWLARGGAANQDPARLPLSDFSEDHLSELYPEAESAKAQRKLLFHAAYQRFVVTQYRGDLGEMRAVLGALADVRRMPDGECLDANALPREGSAEWIPAEITDDIRGLDARYDAAEPGTPATYVVSDQFWPLLTKVAAEEIDSAITSALSNGRSAEAIRATLDALTNVAYLWNRSPSVVGLCYQTGDGAF